MFPSRYNKSINTYAAQNGLDPSLVRAVIWTESRYDKYAVSAKGAKGLMQLMPETFNMLVHEAGLKDADPYDPDTSIRLGCMYLKKLITYFSKDTDKALMAYNAGPGNVKKWHTDNDAFKETKSYLRKVKAVQKYYKFVGK